MPGPVNSNVNQMGLLAKPWDVDNLRQDAWHYATRVQAYSLGMLGFLAAARDGYKYQQRMVTREAYIATLASKGCPSDDGCGFSHGPGNGPFRAVQELDQLLCD